MSIFMYWPLLLPLALAIWILRNRRRNILRATISLAMKHNANSLKMRTSESESIKWNFEMIFNEMSNANEVREWINVNNQKYGFFDEWPRGGGQGQMISAMRKCKFATALEEDANLIESHWYKGVMPWLQIRSIP